MDSFSSAKNGVNPLLNLSNTFGPNMLKDGKNTGVLPLLYQELPGVMVTQKDLTIDTRTNFTTIKDYSCMNILLHFLRP